MKRLVQIALGALGLVLLSVPAAAQQVESGESGLSKEDSEEVSSKAKEQMTYEELARMGIEHYKKEQFEKALKYFKRAYERKDEPDMLYNVGRCHEHLGHSEEAIKFYKQFAENPEVETDARQEALDRVETLQRLRDLEEGNRDETGGGGGAPIRTTGWVVTAAGGGSLLGGGIFAVLASASRSAMRDAPSLSAARNARNRGRNQALYADILFGTGIIAGGVGVALLLSGANGASSSQSAGFFERLDPAVRVRPTVVDGGFGLHVATSF